MRLFLSVIIAVAIVFPVYMIKEAIRAAQPKKIKAEKERLKQLAIDRGHVVIANRIKIQTFSDVNHGGFNVTQSSGIYEYFYNGKRYKYSFRSDHPAMELTLYFVDNPRKATVDGALRKEPKIPWPVAYLIVVAVIYLFMLGM